MAGSQFSLDPRSVPTVTTAHRSIVTPIPTPDVRQAFEALERTEARSMHGQMPVIWDRAEGHRVFDPHGNCWIDFTSTIFVANAGHAHPHIRAALLEAVDRHLLHSYIFAHEIRLKYLDKLTRFVPAPLEKAFLLSAGTEATECAFKLMRLAGARRGKRRLGVVSYEGAMHGRTLAAVMMGGSKASRAWIGWQDPDIHRLPFPYPWTLGDKTGAEVAHEHLRLLEERGLDLASDLCGLMIESYQGWGAVFYPPDYVQVMAGFARDNGVVLTFDEIQSGFGRTGRLFAYQHYGVEPDLVCCGKGMSSSLPLAGVLGRAEIMDLPDIGSMSSTHSANPLVCAAGLANLEVIEREDLVAEARRRGEILHRDLRTLRERHPDRIAHVMGEGMVAAILVKDPATGAPDGDFATRVAVRALEKGLLVVHTGRESIKIGPPLSIPDDALREGVAVLAECFAELTAAP